MKKVALLISAIYNAAITAGILILIFISDHAIRNSEIKDYNITMAKDERIYSHFILIHMGVLLLLMVLSVIFNILWNTRCKKILPEKKYALYQRINFFLSVFPFMLPLVIYPLMAVLLQK